MQDLDQLTRIAIKYGTDKFGAHLYTPIYDRLLKDRRLEELRILEVGIGGYGNPLAGGLSLYAWAEYFPNSKIVGLDIEEKRLAQHPRITVVKGSQEDDGVLGRLWDDHGPFDIIIDDGSHIPWHTIKTFEFFYPKMKSDGIYIVEDTQTAFWRDFGGGPLAENTIHDYAHRVSLAMHAEEVRAGGSNPSLEKYGKITASVQTHRNVVIFERGDNDYPSNHKFDLNHRNVQDIQLSILLEGQRNPSPGNYLTRIDMEVWGKRPEVAISLAKRAVADFPYSQQVLVYAYRIFEENGLDEQCLDAFEKLHRLLPDDHLVSHIVGHYRKKLAEASAVEAVEVPEA